MAGEFEVATLKDIGFTVADTLWKGGASALLEKLGPSPSLKTLLRQKEVPTTRRVSRSELHYKAHQLRECFAGATEVSSREKCKSKLEALLREHSKQPPAAAPMEADDEPVGAQQPLKVGSLVALLPDDAGQADEGSLRHGRLGRIQALHMREEDGELMATVKRVNDAPQPAQGPTGVSSITSFFAPAVKTEYKASQLRCMDHLEVAALGEPLPEDGYESHDGAFPRYGYCGCCLHALNACAIHSASHRGDWPHREVRVRAAAVGCRRRPEVIGADSTPAGVWSLALCAPPGRKTPVRSGAAA